MYYIFPIKEKEMKKEKEKGAKIITQHCSNRKKHSTKKLSCGANKFMMTQQIQETVH